MEQKKQRKLVAIMFIDMVGYTALMQKDEAKARFLRDRLRAVVGQAAGEHDGKVLQFYGDGALVSFNSAIEATRAAIQVQEVLRGDPKVPARIGIHEGDIVFEDEGIYGDGVNVAARIEHLAAPGGICISGKVYDEIRNQPNMKAVSLGRVELKNIRWPIEIYALSGTGLAIPKALEQSRLNESGGNSRLDKNRIAVLPLSNISANADDEYFADGMTEELISRLARVSGLKVIARTSVMRYKHTEKTIAEIGHELKVGTVLEGSVRKSGNRLRVTEQLIDVESEEHLWAEDYDRNLEDVFTIQSEIAEKVAQALKVRLNIGEKAQIRKQPTENVPAYTLYLKGRSWWNKRTAEGLDQAIRYFNHAIEEDPSYSRAYAGLADAYILIAGYGYTPPAEALQHAKSAAEKAVQLDETLAEAHTSLAGVRFLYYDRVNAEREMRRAIELNPNYPTAHHWYAVFLASMGRLEEAIAEELRARELDPFDPVVNTYVGWIYYFNRQYDKALEEYWHTLELHPEFYLTHLWLGQAYEQQGLFEGAIAAFQGALTYSGGSAVAKSSLGHAYALTGRKEEAQKVLKELNNLSKKQYVPSYYIAAIYTGLGDADRAFEWLEKAYHEHYLFLNWIKVDPIFDSLRSDPRFTDLLKRMNLID